VYKGAVPFCSDLRDGVNCRIPQSVRNLSVSASGVFDILALYKLDIIIIIITFRWEEVMQTVPSIYNRVKH